jgi:hypothetical protein
MAQALWKRSAVEDDTAYDAPFTAALLPLYLDACVKQSSQ